MHPVPGAIDDYHLIKKSLEWHVKSTPFIFCLSLEHFTAIQFFLIQSTLQLVLLQERIKTSSINQMESRLPNQLYLNYMGVGILAANTCNFQIDNDWKADHILNSMTTLKC